jgi:hypothetical protein
MKTIVHQTYRTSAVEPWMDRCMASVRNWAQASGFEYRFFDDAMCEYAGAEYCRRVGGNMLAITDLTRLEMAREALDKGFDRTIWVDADVAVFDTAGFTIPIETGYAFCREAWISKWKDGRIGAKIGVNNCVSVFTKDAADLDFLIHAVRHIVSTRAITSSLQVGTWLLSGLSQSLKFAQLTNVGLFSPDVIEAICTGDERILRAQAVSFGHKIAAANLTRSKASEGRKDACAEALEILMATKGDVLNRYVA